MTSPTKSWPHQSSTPKTPRPLVSSASSWAIYQHVGTGSANLRLQIFVASANTHTHTHLQHKRIVLKPTDSEKKKTINWFILDLPKSDQEAWLRSVFSFPPKQPLGAWRRTQLPICGDHGTGSAGLSIVLLAWRTWHLLIGSQNVTNNSPWHLSEPTSSATARSWPLPNTSTTHILAASKEKNTLKGAGIPRPLCGLWLSWRHQSSQRSNNKWKLRNFEHNYRPKATCRKESDVQRSICDGADAPTQFWSHRIGVSNQILGLYIHSSFIWFPAESPPAPEPLGWGSPEPPPWCAWHARAENRENCSSPLKLWNCKSDLTQ